MTPVKDILYEWLEGHGYIGLTGGGCHCDLGDLINCRDEDIATCVPFAPMEEIKPGVSYALKDGEIVLAGQEGDGR